MSEQVASGLSVRLESDGDSAPWDRFVADAPGGHHVQTGMWIQVKAVLGWRAARVVVERDGRCRGGCQVLLRRLPLVGSIGYAPRGPVLADDDPAVLEAILDGLRRLAGRESLAYLKLQPPTNRGDLGPVLEHRGFVRSDLEAAPTATVRILLPGADDEMLLAGMRKTTRNYVRQADRRGVTVRVGKDADLAILSRHLEATARRQGFETYPASYYEQMWRSFAPRGHARLLVAEHDGRALSSSLIIAFGDTALYKLGAWSGEGSALRPNEAVQWAAIRWARDAGFRWYDFEGIDHGTAVAARDGSPLPEAGRRGITHFKLGFGGQVALFPPAYDIAYRALLGRAVHLAAPRLERWRGVAHRLLGRR